MPSLAANFDDAAQETVHHVGGLVNHTKEIDLGQCYGV